MAVSSGTSFILSSILTVLLFSGMQMYRQWFASSQFHTILGGYLGSVLFILILTAIGNIESAVFGKTFQTKLFPEVVLCLLTAVIASGMVHRVCSTTCIVWTFYDQYCLWLPSHFIKKVAISESRIHALNSLIFSLVALYYINRISQQTHTAPAPVYVAPLKKKK